MNKKGNDLYHLVQNMEEGKAEKILSYLSTHYYLSLAVSYRDKPYAAKMKYYADGYDLYFALFKSSYTAQILSQNDYVACTVDNNCVEEFIQVVGDVLLLDSKEDRKKAGAILKNIYSNISFWMYSDDVLFYKLRSYRIKYTMGGKQFKSTKIFGDSFELIIKN